MVCVQRKGRRKAPGNSSAALWSCVGAHPFGTIKHRKGATHFPMKRLKNIRTEMAPGVLAYNLTRAMNIIGIRPLSAAITA